MNESRSYPASASISAARSATADQGYCKALRDHGLPIDPELVITDFYREADKDANAFYPKLVAKAMELGVTAIQAEHDHLAVELLRSAIGLGIDVPGQLSIAGFDNHMISSLVEVPLTTVAQDYSEIGRKAAELIASRIEERGRPGERALVPAAADRKGVHLRDRNPCFRTATNLNFAAEFLPIPS